MPRVSIILATWNRAEMLKSAIEAALAQTYQDFELLILDNASTDNTSEVVKTFTDPRIVYIRRSVNGGAPANWKEGFRRASGEFVLYSHDDDRLHPTIVEREVNAMDRHPGAVMVGTNVRIIDFEGNVIQERSNPEINDRVFGKGGFIKAYMQRRFTIASSTQMMRMNRSGNVLNLKHQPHKDFGPCGDVHLVCRSNVFGEVVWLADPLLDYRTHPGQESLTLDITPSDIIVHEEVLKLCNRKGLEWCKPFVKASLLRHKLLQAILAGKNPDRLLDKLEAIEKGHAPRPYSLPVRPDGRTRSLQGKQVAILGSTLNAFFLLRDCKKSGVHVVAILDSNPKRWDSRMEYYSIDPLSNLINMPDLDAVLVSCEKRSKEQIDPFVKLITDAPLIHWSEL